MILAITIFTIIANIYLGSAVFLRNPKSTTNWLFGAYALCVALWAFTNYLALVPGLSPEMSLLRIRIVMVVAAFLCPLLYLLAYKFPDNKEKIPTVANVTFWIFVGATALISITPITFSGVTIVNGFPSPVPGPGILVYALNAFVLPIFAFIVLYKKFKVATGRVRLQLQMFMWGVAGAYAFAEITNFIIVNVFKRTELAVLGPFFSLILVGCVFYAITRYRFLDIKILILRSVTYILLLGSVALFYVFGIVVGLRYIFPNLILSDDIYWFLLFLSFAIAIGINPLYRGLEKVIGKFFFKGAYDSEKLIFRVMQIMATEVDFDLIAPKVLDAVMKDVSINKSAILVVENHRIVDVKEAGFGEHSFAEPKKLQLLEDLFHRPNVGEILVFEDIEDEALKEVFRGLDTEIIIPIKVEGREVALMLFGERSAGDMYTAHDLGVLQIIAKQIGESIESTNKFKMLKLVDKIRSDFVDSVSHEFRTPLTESRWKLEMLLDPASKTKMTKELKKDVGDIYLSIGWLVESLNQLIFVSEFEVKEPTLSKQETEMKTFFAKEVFHTVKEISEFKKTTLSLDAPEEIPLIKIDSERIKQVFNILLENAIKYSKDGSKVIVHLLNRETPDGQKFLRIAVADSGIGIDEKDLPHMFSKFYRGENARHAVPNGLGIGLFIAKAIVELHGGKIWAESKKGKGSTFFVELPY
jgi:signal transduction histidine kinase